MRIMRTLAERHTQAQQDRRATQFEEQCLEAATGVDPASLIEDPELCDSTGPSNDDRAQFAKEALAAFNIETGSDLETAIRDLIADLAHFCDRHKLDITEEFEAGFQMYREETDNKGSQLERGNS